MLKTLIFLLIPAILYKRDFQRSHEQIENKPCYDATQKRMFQFPKLKLLTFSLIMPWVMPNVYFTNYDI